ncbi:hypothetical protein ACOMHN_004706 [Nucella lapillus]
MGKLASVHGRVAFFLTSMSTTCSTFAVVLVALHRLWRVAKPSFFRLTSVRPYHYLAMAVLPALLVTVPFFPLYGVYTVRLSIRHRNATQIQMCWVDDAFKEGFYLNVYKAVLGITTVVSLGLIVAPYCLIMHHISILQKSMKERLSQALERFPAPSIYPVVKEARRPRYVVNSVTSEKNVILPFFRAGGQENEMYFSSGEYTLPSLSQEHSPLLDIFERLRQTSNLSMSHSIGVENSLLQSQDLLLRRSSECESEYEPLTRNIQHPASVIQELTPVKEGEVVANTLTPLTTATPRMSIFKAVRSYSLGLIFRKKSMFKSTFNFGVVRNELEVFEAEKYLKDVWLRFAQTLIIIIVLFLVTWFPFFFLRLFRDGPPDLCKPYNACLLHNPSFYVSCVYMGSVFNPTIYCFTNDYFRTNFRSLLSECSRKWQNTAINRKVQMQKNLQRDTLKPKARGSVKGKTMPRMKTLKWGEDVEGGNKECKGEVGGGKEGGAEDLKTAGLWKG